MSLLYSIRFPSRWATPHGACFTLGHRLTSERSFQAGSPCSSHGLRSSSFQANEMLLSGRKLTAQEACGKGLVSQVFWPGTFTQEVMVRIKELASCNPVVRPAPLPPFLCRVMQSQAEAGPLHPVGAKGARLDRRSH